MKGKRIYRVETDDGLQYVVENGDRVFHLVGDLFESWEIGAELPDGLEDLKIVAPIVPSKIVARPELPGARGRAGQAPAARAAHLHQAVHQRDWAGRGDRDPARNRARGSRGGGRRRDWPPRDARAGRRGEPLHPRRHGGQRRHRARDPAPGGAIHAAQGFDTFAPVGPAIALGLDPDALAVEGWVNAERRQARPPAISSSPWRSWSRSSRV